MWNQNSNIMAVLNKAADMVILSILWVVFSLPILTIGASSAALYQTIIKVIRQNRGYAWSTFLQAFRSSLKQGIASTLIFLLLYTVFGTTCYLCWQRPDSMIAGVYVAFSVFCILICLAAQIHCFSLIGRFRLNGRELFTLLVRLSLGHLFRNFTLLCMLLFAAEVSLYHPLFLLFIVPSAFLWLCSYVQEPLFKKHIRYQDDFETDTL